jgi:hypothetical protein
MEFVDGRDLASEVEKAGPLSRRRTAPTPPRIIAARFRPHPCLDR